MCDVFFCFFIKVKLLKESLHQTCLGSIMLFLEMKTAQKSSYCC